MVRKEEARKGRQTPTQSIVLPYEETRGEDAIKLYNSSGRNALEWQELLIYDLLAINEDELWVHTKFGIAVPRRNGKNEVVIMRELYGLMHGERIMHTAHRTMTSHSAWERLCDLLDLMKIEYRSIKASGKENIRLDNGGRIEFRTRSPKGGLGEGYDLLIIDEAQEYTPDQESALKYVVSDSQNPQTIFCGTPPTPTSSGTVFIKMRNAALHGETQNTGWAEWSVEEQSDPEDRELWYETNPSLGTILTERKIADEIGPDAVDFNIQRLGLWLRYNQQSAISRHEWEELQCKTPPKLIGKTYVGIKFGKDGGGVALSVAAKTEDCRIMVECYDWKQTRYGFGWIIDFIRKADIGGVAVDGANGQQGLAGEMKQAKLKAPKLPTVKEVIAANSSFEQGVLTKKLCHMGQPSVTRVASNCEKRAIGTSGGFGYRSLLDGAAIEILESIALAYWQCDEAKEPVKQRISY